MSICKNFGLKFQYSWGFRQGPIWNNMTLAAEAVTRRAALRQLDPSSRFAATYPRHQPTNTNQRRQYIVYSNEREVKNTKMKHNVHTLTPSRFLTEFWTSWHETWWRRLKLLWPSRWSRLKISRNSNLTMQHWMYTPVGQLPTSGQSLTYWLIRLGALVLWPWSCYMAPYKLSRYY